jgi:hypothetical protein
MVYVVKSQLADHRILGTRSLQAMGIASLKME